MASHICIAELLSYHLALLFPSVRLTKLQKSNGHPHDPFQFRPSLCSSLDSNQFIAVPCAPPSSYPSGQLISLSWLTPAVTPLLLCYCRSSSLFHRNMSLALFWFLSLFLSTLLPSRSSPVSSPAIVGSYDQAFMGGDFDPELSSTTAIVPLTHGAQLRPPSTDSLVPFSPQDPSADGFTKLLHEHSDVASVSPESDPTILHHYIIQGQSNSSMSLMMAYYPAWVAKTFPPERIDFSLFDWIDFAFAVPNANYSLDWDGSETAPDTLTRLVDVAHQRGTKVKLSVGGWSGSKYVTHVVAQRRPALTLSPQVVLAYAGERSQPTNFCRQHRKRLCPISLRRNRHRLGISWRTRGSAELRRPKRYG